jgi:hypothetical protein
MSNARTIADLAAVTATAAELNLTDGSAADTVVNSKAVVYGSAGEVTVNELDVDNIQLDANAIKSTNTNGNIQLFPNGTGYTELYGNTNAGAVRFNCESNSHGVTLKGPPHSAAATYSLELPDADGSSGEVLQTNGSGKLSFGSAGGGGLQSMQVFTTSGTWTKPAGISKIRVTVTGGGGGGGGTRAGYGEGAGGGGAGGTAIEIIDVSSVSSVTVTVASGGAGGSGASDGSSGGNSSFGTYCYGNAGSGGSNHGTANGGIGGSASGGDINIPGGGGSHGVNNNTNQTGQGQGGSSYWGGGYRTQEDTNANGGDAEAYGSGGGGAVNKTNGGDLTGGAGKGGIVVVEEFA